MHVQVITGDGSIRDSFLLKRVSGQLDWLGVTIKTVYAEAYGGAALVEILHVCAAHKRELLVLGCTGEQIRSVLEWQSATYEMIELEDLVIHLVKRMDSTAHPVGPDRK
ncbi:hypothetical protein [Pseudomonas sp. TH31]|uniref:hypothetical protein n=1 Tax=Pseudomonas sp. TH31 TaxID=2796396 RepID=UPI0019140920|nr:hypothetical protein [Pseudomonas sp. TH31]MBK5415068.1 hypothetical protein [Pseudomonas sp. TH31]